MKSAHKFVDRAMEMTPHSSSIQLIAARLNLATGRVKEAQTHFKKAMKIDETSIETMNGRQIISFVFF